MSGIERPETDRREADHREAILLEAEGWELIQRGFAGDRRLLDAAEERFRKAETLCRSWGDREGLVGILSGRAAILRNSGEKEKILAAIDLYTEEIALLADAGREREVAAYQCNVALAYRDLATADPEGAIEFIGRGLDEGRRALALNEKLGHRPGLAQGSSVIADLCLLLADRDPELKENHLATAATLYRTAEELWTGIDPEGQAMARMGLAEAYIGMGKNLDGAEALLDEAAREYTGEGETGRPVAYQLSQIHALRSRLLQAQGRTEEALEERRLAIELLNKAGFGRGGAE